MRALEKIYRFLKSEYKVENLNIQNSKYIFVLESPHTEELKNGVPVAGGSGKLMTKYIFDEYDKKSNIAIGIYIRDKHQKDEKVSRFGIVNISNIPMQAKAYPQDIQNEYGEFLRILEKLRKNPKRLSEDEQMVKDMLILDLKEEIGKTREKSIFIPCGKTAQEYFEYIIDEIDEDRVIREIPHPSFGNWAKKKYEKNIMSMKKQMDL